VLEKETNDVIYKTKVRMMFGKKMEHFVQQTVASIWYLKSVWNARPTRSADIICELCCHKKAF
jgi:hypothetical protein